MSSGAVTPVGLPDWLQPVVDVCAGATARDFSRIIAPAGSRPRRASVLVLFGAGPKGPQVLLLERAPEMRSHAGQVAFPGGGYDEADADEVATALREAHEETGLDPTGVTVIGVLPALWLPPSNFSVTPVVGWWHAPSPVAAADPAETASVATVPLNELIDPANRASVRHPSGYMGPAFVVRDLVVWGFTAGLLSRLFALVGWELPWDHDKVIDLPAGGGVLTDARVEAGAEP